MTGIDIPISNLRNAFASRLWGDVDKKIYYSRVFRNLNTQKELIGEVFISDKEYKEVHFDDTYHVNCFFDVADEISNTETGLQTTREVGIVFAVRVDKIYPDLDYRAVEELYSDVLAVINDSEGRRVIPDNIITGLNAYGDLSTANLKAYDMQPWHVFRVNTTMQVNYGCAITYTPSQINAFEYPFPIIFYN